MPVDQKRINGPDLTIPYNIYIEASASKSDENEENLVAKRGDGRAHNELRKIFVKAGIVSQAKGSAYIEIGKTKVVCSVFDPRETPNKSGYSVQGSLYCEFKFASFSCTKRRIHQQDVEEKEYSLIMRRALEPAVCRHEFPNFQVDVYALVLDNGGSSLGAAITASSLALANAGIPMFGLVTAVSMGIGSDVSLLDPTDEEEFICQSAPKNSKKGMNHGIVTQASLVQHNQITELYFVGDIEPSSLKAAIETMNEASKNLSPVIQRCLVKSVIKSLKERERERPRGRLSTEMHK